MSSLLREFRVRLKRKSVASEVEKRRRPYNEVGVELRGLSLFTVSKYHNINSRGDVRTRGAESSLARVRETEREARDASARGRSSPTDRSSFVSVVTESAVSQEKALQRSTARRQPVRYDNTRWRPPDCASMFARVWLEHARFLLTLPVLLLLLIIKQALTNTWLTDNSTQSRGISRNLVQLRSYGVSRVSQHKRLVLDQPPHSWRHFTSPSLPGAGRKQSTSRHDTKRDETAVSKIEAKFSETTTLKLFVFKTYLRKKKRNLWINWLTTRLLCCGQHDWPTANKTWIEQCIISLINKQKELGPC